ncbi:uncharacterized protein C8orf58 homolog isoform X2 [Podarcis raffonei]|uniref:uncharacterized protein C8orf58 homolog isoform X2 n=1 Tax=Podarcis raffonei TaxID=65483 RepID=UPI0023295883|nr:uncharacterized protein C8orf58 homolog isoform X2 [Podarcis raffonei]XP_053223002.1 uncharacterized protein C8orf58 homolog isoform X2 [Podarcis raffonei]XP_053223003.1 uncharacterized protein C8orf58 homolog isoform X2 [Podarcis raffonei]XP_053223004.1 uncharacterized protein C8orf58 homolog isoform X2 [Podarcis raffonei]
MFQSLQEPQLQCPLDMELDGKKISRVDRLDEAGSLAEPIPHQLGFLPISGRFLKSESEDSGVEMTSNDHSPSSPEGSEKSFCLDCLDVFQPSMEDSPPLSAAPCQGFPKGEEQEDLGPIQDRAYCRNLSASKKLAQVVQRSQKHQVPRRSPGRLGQRPRSPVDLEGLNSYRLHRAASVNENVDAAAGELIPMLSGNSTPEEWSPQGQVHETLLTMPGQGLRYLEHICQMLEKIARLQQANLRLQHQQQIMECRVRVQESENEGFSEDVPDGPGLMTLEMQAEVPATMEKVAEEEHLKSADSWHPHHFRARSASDTRALRSPARNLGNKDGCPQKSTAHSASSPSLLDQLDGGSHTLPPGMKLKNIYHIGQRRIPTQVAFPAHSGCKKAQIERPFHAVSHRFSWRHDRSGAPKSVLSCTWTLLPFPVSLLGAEMLHPL